MAQARRNNSWVCQIQGQGRGMPRGEVKLKVPAGSQLGSGLSSFSSKHHGVEGGAYPAALWEDLWIRAARAERG